MSTFEGRDTYEGIKALTLESYYDFCRDYGLSSDGVGKRWSHAEVFAWIDDSFISVFDPPLEIMMLWVAQLVISGGLHPSAEEKFRKSIIDCIAEHGLENLMKDVPQEEVDVFVSDLQILRLIDTAPTMARRYDRHFILEDKTRRKEKGQGPYETIKFLSLDIYYNFCRDFGVIHHLPHKEILKRVEDAFEGVFDSTTEILIFSVVQLVLSGGWYPDLEEWHKKHIIDCLAEYGLENLMEDVSKQDADVFTHDLYILKLT